MEYLSAIARRLHHTREPGKTWDNQAWFEYAPAAKDAFDEWRHRLRSRQEGSHAEAALEIRLVRHR